jgi:hypothetical protein
LLSFVEDRGPRSGQPRLLVIEFAGTFDFFRRTYMGTEELVARNVVILPSQSVTAMATRWSEELQRFGKTHFVLFSNAFPHASLYQAAYPPANLSFLVAVVRHIAHETAPLVVRMNSFGVFGKTWIFWDAVKSAALTRLHHRLVSGLNPLREGRLLPVQADLLKDMSMPEENRESLQTYGNPLCELCERPHITLTRFVDAAAVPGALDYLRTQSPPGATIAVDRIFLSDVGPHGTCPRVLEEFRLTG